MKKEPLILNDEGASQWKFPIVIGLLLLTMGVKSQAILNRFYLRTGYSNSTHTIGQLDLQTGNEEHHINAFYFGVDYHFLKVKNNVFCSAGIQLLEKGFKRSYGSNTNAYNWYHVNYQYNLSYLEFPIGMTVKHKGFNYFVNLVPDILLGSTWLFKETDVYQTGTINKVNHRDNIVSVNAWNYFKNYDLGMNLGVSKQLFDFLSLEIRLQKGFVSPIKVPTSDMGYLQTLMIGLRYQL